MKIDKSAYDALSGLDLDPPRFVSDLPSDDLIEGAYGSKELKRFLTEEQIGARMTITASTATQFAQGLSGLNIGIPSPILGAFKDAVGTIAAGKWESFARGTSQALVDVGLNAMGALPMIGWAAKLALSVIDLIQSRSAAKAPPPPQIRYNKVRDEELATLALRLYTGHAQGDGLRSVFLPPVSNVTAWRVEPREPGFVVEADGPITTPKMGIVPGYGIAVGDLRSLTHWSGDYGKSDQPLGDLDCPDVPPENRSGYDPAEDLRSGRRRVHCAWDSKYAGTITSTGDLYPSLRRVGAALWSMASCTKSAQCFDLDTAGIPEKWQQWEDAALAAALDAWTGGVRLYTDRVVGFEALQRSTRLDFFGVNSSLTVAQAVQRRIAGMRELQLKLLDSLVVAYASEKQAAFSSPNLANLLQVRRKQLLKHPARWKVDLRDIPDLDYRDAMREATPAGSRPLATTAPSTLTGAPFEQPAPTGLAPLGDPELPPSGSGPRKGLPAWAWAALLAAGFFAVSKKR